MTANRLQLDKCQRHKSDKDSQGSRPLHRNMFQNHKIKRSDHYRIDLLFPISAFPPSSRIESLRQALAPWASFSTEAKLASETLEGAEERQREKADFPKRRGGTSRVGSVELFPFPNDEY